MSVKKVYISRIIVPDAIEKLRENFEIEVWEDPAPAPKEIIMEKAREFDGMMIESNDLMDAEVFAHSDRLKDVSYTHLRAHET